MFVISEGEHAKQTGLISNHVISREPDNPGGHIVKAEALYGLGKYYLWGFQKMEKSTTIHEKNSEMLAEKS